MIRRSSNKKSASIASSKMLGRDVAYVGSAGLRARPGRTVLSALGVAIGIAAMISVVGSSASSQERLNSQLAELGTNLLTVSTAQAAGGVPPPDLPANASARVERLPGVLSAASIADLREVHVYRNALIEPDRTGGLTVTAAELGLLDIVGATIDKGRWLDEATAQLPAVVLGSGAAKRLGVTAPGLLVHIGDTDALVTGILNPVVLAPELDTAALVGMDAAASVFRQQPVPTRLYERSTDAAVAQVRTLISATVQPQQPGAVAVSRPSDALAAATAANQAFTGLLLALGSIALIVGGIGVANTMIISVLERRREIGLRRSMGATRRHIRLQFLAEALLLSAMGGVLGAALGSGVTVIIALSNNWIPVVPPLVLVAGVGATLLVGALAGLYPAMRAARTSPTAALNG